MSIHFTIDSFLSQFIVYLREQGITVTEAANQIGITRSHLSKVIHQKTSPSIELLEKMETSVIYLEVYTKKQLLQAIEILKAL